MIRERQHACVSVHDNTGGGWDVSVEEWECVRIKNHYLSMVRFSSGVPYTPPGDFPILC